MKLLLCYFIVIYLCTTIYCIEFKYPSYAFRKKSSWARRVNSKERECKGSPCDVGRDNFRLTPDQLKCVRNCISEKCYNELYAWDELEEGEIDVRANSFKGCAVQEMKDNHKNDI